jgi:hypothetical protein
MSNAHVSSTEGVQHPGCMLVSAAPQQPGWDTAGLICKCIRKLLEGAQSWTSNKLTPRRNSEAARKDRQTGKGTDGQRKPQLTPSHVGWFIFGRGHSASIPKEQSSISHAEATAGLHGKEGSSISTSGHPLP